MDPDKCFDAILDCIACRQYGEAIEAAENLAAWLAKGGFAPGGGKLDRQHIAKFVDWVLDDLSNLTEVSE